MVAVKEATNVGKITQVIGPVIDAQFPSGKLPRIYNALKVPAPWGVFLTFLVNQLTTKAPCPLVKLSLITDPLLNWWIWKPSPRYLKQVLR